MSVSELCIGRFVDTTARRTLHDAWVLISPALRRRRSTPAPSVRWQSAGRRRPAHILAAGSRRRVSAPRDREVIVSATAVASWRVSLASQPDPPVRMD